MPIFRKLLRVEVQPWLCFIFAALLLLIPLKWILAWLAATVTHEIFHYIVIRISKVPVYTLQFGISGMIMETGPMPWYTELVSSLAGPIGALGLILFSSWFPEVGICAYIQSAFNLLPVYPLDGGRAVRCVSTRILPHFWSSKIILGTEIITIGILSCVGIYMSFGMRLGLVPVLVVIMIVFKVQKAKCPCKEGKQRVQ